MKSRALEKMAIRNTFNQRFPIGTDVLYQPVKGVQQFEQTKIRSDAWVLGHGEIVVKIEGHAGGVAISHITPRTEAR